VEVVRFRSGATRVLGVVTMLVAGIALAALIVAGAWRDVVQLGGPIGLVALVGYAALWAPYVDVSDGGVEMANVLRTVRVPWPAVHEVDGRYGLRLTTAYGKFAAWAAPAPRGRDRMQGTDSEAASLVRSRLERLRAQGHLDNPRLESDRAAVEWHWWIVAGAITLTVTTVLVGVLD
jgi:hypothetical protein